MRRTSQKRVRSNEEALQLATTLLNSTFWLPGLETNTVYRWIHDDNDGDPS